MGLVKNPLRYNFCPIAGAPIAGRTHTPESKAQISDSPPYSGTNNPMYGKVPASAFQIGKGPNKSYVMGTTYCLTPWLLRSLPPPIVAFLYQRKATTPPF